MARIKDEIKEEKEEAKEETGKLQVVTFEQFLNLKLDAIIAENQEIVRKLNIIIEMAEKTQE